MHSAPTITSHIAPAMADSTTPKTAAAPNAMNAASFTCSGLASPEPVRRVGPVRSSSVPRMPSE